MNNGNAGEVNDYTFFEVCIFQYYRINRVAILVYSLHQIIVINQAKDNETATNSILVFSLNI
jgi:hypothetical protein